MNLISYSNHTIKIKKVKNAIKNLKKGKGIIVLDDKNRENEGDIIFIAETMTIEQMAFTIRYGSGIICLCITEEKRKKLNLPMMVKNNSNQFQTPFTVSIESSEGITTGVSAKDRLKTIKKAIAENAKPTDLNRPGHVFPLRARDGGVLERRGHTEAAVDLAILAGFKPAGVICELTNKDGSIAKEKESILFANKYNMPLITIEDLVLYRKNINNKKLI